MKKEGAYQLFVTLILLGMLFALSASAQQTAAVVPHFVRFGGTLTNGSGHPLTGTVGVTFSLYADQQSVTPLWFETQNVVADRNGHYSIQLGSTKLDGLPTDLFTSGEARWLGVQPEGQAEQPRVLLLSVPYALKAGDAETVGGLPPSAFVLSNAGPASTNAKGSGASVSPKSSVPPANPAVTGKGVLDYIPMWDTASDIVDSVIFQKSSLIGIATTTPAATLDVNGKTDVRDTFTLFPKSTDPTLAINGTTFKIDSTGKVTFVSGQTFPGAGTITGITTATGSGLSGGGTTGTLSLKIPSAGITNAMLASSKITLNANTAGGLTTPGAMTLGTTYTIGLKPCSANQILQYSGTVWNCATGGSGTITGVTAGTDLTGGGTSGTVKLSLDTTKVPLLAASNTFTGNQSVSGTVTATSFSGNGANLTNVNASQLGGLASSAFAQLSANNTFSGTQTVNNSISINSSNISSMNVNNTGAGNGIQAFANNSSGYALYGGNSGAGTGVGGVGSINGVYGSSTSSTGVGMHGLWGTSSSYGNGTSGVGVWGDSSVGAGVYGTSDGTSAGVIGASNSGQGVVGFSNSSVGVYADSVMAQGVVAISDSYVGAYGEYVYTSNTGAGFGSAGVWGDTGATTAFGVLGTADDGNALFGKNYSTGNETLYVENDGAPSGGVSPAAARFAGPGAATWCEIFMDPSNNNVGDLTCTGTKSAAVPVDGNRMVRLYAVEATDNWFEDAGSAQLTDGKVVVPFERVFAQTVNGEADYHVFLTPNGECEGLYIASKSAQGFEVRELHGGHSNISFDYRLMARRKGYEQVRMEDVTAQFELAKRNAEQRAQLLEANKLKHKMPERPALPHKNGHNTALPVSQPAPVKISSGSR